MAVPFAIGTDVAAALGDILRAADPNLRVYDYVADSFRPPGVVISLPEIDYADQSGGFCRAVWTFTLAIAVSRNTDREAQNKLLDLVDRVARALDAAEPADVWSVEALAAFPAPVTVSGQDLPGYQLTARVRA